MSNASSVRQVKQYQCGARPALRSLCRRARWELHIPSIAASVYAALTAAGGFGIANQARPSSSAPGKGFRLGGGNLPDHSPSSRPRLGRTLISIRPFRDAPRSKLKSTSDAGLCCFHCRSIGPFARRETIYRDGKRSGWLTSAVTGTLLAGPSVRLVRDPTTSSRATNCCPSATNSKSQPCACRRNILNPLYHPTMSPQGLSLAASAHRGELPYRSSRSARLPDC